MADNIAAQTDATKSLATDEISGVHYPRTKLVIGNDGVNDGDISATNPLPVAIGTWNGLTDAQLRGTPVQVTGTVGLDGAALAALENITVAGAVELGATSLSALENVTVGGTVDLGATSLAALENITVGGTVDLGATSLAALESITAVGPLTDGQLRATAVPVSLASVPLATGAATETTLAGLNAKVPSGLSVSTGRLVVDGSGVVQPVTVGNFPATQPVSAASLPLPAGAATEASLAALLAVAKAEDDPAVSGDKGFPLLAMRQLADTTSTDNDGDYTLIKIDEEGRVKVATKPASFTLVSGNITAAAQTVFCDVSRASNVMISLVATTLVGHNATFEGSIDSTDGTNGNWFGIQVIRSNANTIELVTGVLAATPAYAWEASVNGLSFIRVRATAHTSGTATWKFQRGSYATEPIPAAQISGTQPISGTLTSITSTISSNLNTNGIVADVASAALTTTTTTAAVTLSAGTSYEVNVPVTVVSGTSPTLDIGIEESDDTGTNWFRVYDFPRITATGIYRSPKLQCVGNRVRYVQTVGGTTPSFTRAINRMQYNDMVDQIRQLIDRSLASAQALNAVTASLNTQNCRNVQLLINATTITTTAPALQLEGSDDNGATWYAIGAPLTAVANSTVRLTVPDVHAALIRARVSTAGAAATLGYVLLKGF